MQVSYSLPVEELFTRVTEMIICHTRRLNILEDCESDERALDMPSWVTDWTTPTPDHSRIQRHHADLATCAVLNIHGGALETKGILCDEVEALHRFNFESTALDIPEVDLISRHLLQSTLNRWPGTKETTIIQNIVYIIMQGEFAEFSIPPELHHTSGKPISFQNIVRAFELFAGAPYGEDDPELEEWSARFEDLTILAEEFGRNLARRTIIKTAGRRLGIAPVGTVTGDIVAILLGLSVPAILRPRPDGSYKFVGPSLVHGLNWGKDSLESYRQIGASPKSRQVRNTGRWCFGTWLLGM